MQPVDDLVCPFIVYQPVVVVIIFHVRLENLVHQVERVHGLEQFVVPAFAQLPNVCFRRIEKHSLLEFLRPYHLHFHNELPSHGVFAAYVHDAVLAERVVRHHLAGQIFHAGHFLFRFVERQKGVEQAHDQIRMLAEYFFEREVGFRV